MKQKSTYTLAPKLVGYQYSPEQVHEARDNGKLLSLRAPTSFKCNLSCIYCSNDSGKKHPDELSYDEILDLIKQAKLLGAKSIVLVSGGEPTIYPQFKNLIAYITSHDMIPVTFTNALTMSKDLAKFLYDANASVMIKLDSLKEDVQDNLVGRKGAYQLMRKGLDNLLEVGFADVEDQLQLRLGASFVVSRLNMDEVPNIFLFCRQHRLFPNFEMMRPNGRAKKLTELIPTISEWKNLKLYLLDQDRKQFGYDWLPYTPLLSCGCLQFMCSIYVTVTGNARPCNGIRPDLANLVLNVRKMSLSEIINTPFFQHARYIDKYVSGVCRKCEYNFECVGCRGMAFSNGINSGKNAFEALCCEDPTCFKLLESDMNHTFCKKYPAVPFITKAPLDADNVLTPAHPDS